jgi:hypothetical protein
MTTLARITRGPSGFDIRTFECPAETKDRLVSQVPVGLVREGETYSPEVIAHRGSPNKALPLEKSRLRQDEGRINVQYCRDCRHGHALAVVELLQSYNDHPLRATDA